MIRSKHFPPGGYFINSHSLFSWLCIDLLERFSYDLDMKTREQNRNNKRTEIERFDWFIERIQTSVAFRWLSERWGEKTSCPKNFLEINRYFTLTSYLNTIGQSNNALSILGFFFGGKTESMFWSFHPLADKSNNEHFTKTSFQGHTKIARIDVCHSWDLQAG